ncbi:hypothetical protein K523DRAFT_133585 [Schizophyllum commune Tattone D]|nr:hypothetical protein K523DRAFT_133585 [Schizophyllum commune Tattone D]
MRQNDGSGQLLVSHNCVGRSYRCTQRRGVPSLLLAAGIRHCARVVYPSSRCIKLCAYRSAACRYIWSTRRRPRGSAPVRRASPQCRWASG